MNYWTTGERKIAKKNKSTNSLLGEKIFFEKVSLQG